MPDCLVVVADFLFVNRNQIEKNLVPFRQTVLGQRYWPGQEKSSPAVSGSKYLLLLLACSPSHLGHEDAMMGGMWEQPDRANCDFLGTVITVFRHFELVTPTIIQLSVWWQWHNPLSSPSHVTLVSRVTFSRHSPRFLPMCPSLTSSAIIADVCIC